jgi:hypothetical protein
MGNMSCDGLASNQVRFTYIHCTCMAIYGPVHEESHRCSLAAFLCVRLNLPAPAAERGTELQINCLAKPTDGPKLTSSLHLPDPPLALGVLRLPNVTRQDMPCAPRGCFER